MANSTAAVHMAATSLAGLHAGTSSSSSPSSGESRCRGSRSMWKAADATSDRCVVGLGKGFEELSSAACTKCATWPLLRDRSTRRRNARSLISAQASMSSSYPDYTDGASLRGGVGARSESVWTPMVSRASDIWSMSQIDCPQNAYTSPVAQGQGPPAMLQERFQSVISQLFQYRIIRCGGAVDDDMANLIVAQLLYLDAVDSKKDIIMYVNSPGGSVTAGMAIFDTMRHIRPDVSTVCVGLAASMGAFLLSGGAKGKRYSLPNSRIMIHQPLGGAQGQQTDIEIQANEILHHKANLNGYLAYHTGQTLEKIVQDTDRDFFMSAKEAVDYGLIDHVISNPLKALQLTAPAPAPSSS